MTEREESIRYFADPKRKCGAWRWHHKDFTHTYLGKIGNRIVADEGQGERGFETRQEALAFARAHRQRAIELLAEIERTKGGEE